MTKILFVCHGNICRSPMAEFVFAELARRAGREGEFAVASAATSREEIGNDMYPPAKACLRSHGIPFARRHARQVTRADYDDYDLLIIMEEYNRRNLRRILPDDPENKVRTLMSFTGSDRDVADPWYTDDFETAYDDILRGCTALLEAL
ncbi:MAG: low molecular weight phosphotyrosine protein phosphatase [Ruminococcus sp.]|nr:low molecular weight phosphotyrosine protein phosphatase [Ruminococcus sp.]